MADDGESVMGDGTADRGEQFTAPNRPVMSGPMLIIDRSIDRPTRAPFLPPGPGPVPTVPDTGRGQNANKFGESTRGGKRVDPRLRELSRQGQGRSGKKWKKVRAIYFGDPQGQQ